MINMIEGSVDGHLEITSVGDLGLSGHLRVIGSDIAGLWDLDVCTVFVDILVDVGVNDIFDG